MSKRFGARAGVALAALVVAVAMTALAGCGSSSDGTSSGGSEGASTSSEGSSTTASGTGSGGVKAAEDLLAEYSAPPEFEPPGPAFDAKQVMAGKSLFSVPANTSNPFCQALIKGLEEVAEKVGYKFSYWQNQANTSEWVEGMNRGIATHPAVIDLTGGSSPELLKPQIEDAQANGIDVTDSAINGITGEGGIEKSPYVNFTNGLPYRLAGELEAAWTIKDTNGAANVLVITSNDATSSPIMYEGISETFDKNCPECKYTSVDVPLAEWSKKITPAVQGALAQDPNINYVIPLFDSESPFVIAALKTAGKTGDVKISTFNGTPEMLELVEQGEIAMDAAQNLTWVSYAISDNAMRLAGGLKPIANENIGMQILTPDNVASFNPDAYIQGYSKLWELE